MTRNTKHRKEQSDSRLESSVEESLYIDEWHAKLCVQSTYLLAVPEGLDEKKGKSKVKVAGEPSTK